MRRTRNMRFTAGLSSGPLVAALLLSLLLFHARPSTAQVSLPEKVDSVLSQWEEVYFRAYAPGPSIRDLNRLISIHRVSGDTIFAFANEKEMRAFSTLNLEYQLLPNPSISHPVMLDTLGENIPLAWDFYPSYPAYETMMASFETNYPGLCRLDTLAVLPSGRQLLLAKISDNVSQREAEPVILYTSSMHGNELTGYVLMLRLIDYLLQQYGTDSLVTELVDNVEIWINPLANPDGTFHGGNNTVSGAIRYNSNGVDLNRNYPDPQDGPHPDGEAWQPETLAFMALADSHDFTLGLNFHGGAEVFNYPWDTWATLTADNDWWMTVAGNYADTVHAHAPASYLNDLDNGMTNGYAWYEVNGGRQDYMNYFRHCREATLELSWQFIPPASSLPNFWNYNYRSLLYFIRESLFGVRGLVIDSLTGNPLKAKVFIDGHDLDSSHVYSALPAGDYHRCIAPGTYDLTFSAPGYQPKTISGVGVAAFGSTVQDVQLVPEGATLQGSLVYDNDTQTPLPGFTVYLLSMNNDTLEMSLTGPGGSFSFTLPDTGTFQLGFTPSCPPGGINSVDALLALKHFVQLELLSGLRLAAADVNGSGVVNSVDALMVQKYFIQMIGGFPTEPWIFENQPVSVGTGGGACLVKSICTGDANGSFQPVCP